MKYLILLAILFVGCEKKEQPKPAAKTRNVTISATSHKGNYSLKYTRVTGWVDTIINQPNYSVNFTMLESDLQKVFQMKSISVNATDTFKLSITINHTIEQIGILDSNHVELQLQPNRAL